MIDKYEQAIKETFKYLNDYLSDWENITIAPYWMMIQAHMKHLNFDVRCVAKSDYADTVIVYPQVDNLPIHIWKKK